MLDLQPPPPQHYVSGEDVHFAKLTAEDVLAIRYLSQYKGLTRRQLARAFRVSLSSISSIRRNTTWKNVQLTEEYVRLRQLQEQEEQRSSEAADGQR